MSDIDKAIETLDNMEAIIQKEMLVKGTYSTEIVNYDLLASGAICGGRRYCAIGTMAVAFGIKSHLREPGSAEWYQSDEFESVIGGDRRDYIDSLPALKLVHDALNVEAIEFVKEVPGCVVNKSWAGTDYSAPLDGFHVSVASYHISPIESLFESSSYFANTEDGRHDLLGIVRRAKERITADAGVPA